MGKCLSNYVAMFLQKRGMVPEQDVAPVNVEQSFGA
jgi:hypothetical protein